MRIALWTKSPPKIEAITEACKQYPFFSWGDISIISEAIPSLVADMPLSLEENMKWAENRAIWARELLKEKSEHADFYVWMEWWWMLIWEKWYLFGTVCIINNDWKKHFWFSSMIEIPQDIKKRLYEDNEELWPIMDELTWIYRTKDWEWCIWTWTYLWD